MEPVTAWEAYLQEHPGFRKAYKPLSLPLKDRQILATFYDSQFSYIEVRKNPTRVVAIAKIPKQFLIGEHMGVVVNLATLAPSKSTTFFVSIDTATAIDGSPQIRDPNTAEFRARAKVQYLRDGKDNANAYYVIHNGRVLVYAKQDIAGGEEVTLNYADVLEAKYNRNGAPPLPPPLYSQPSRTSREVKLDV